MLVKNLYVYRLGQWARASWALFKHRLLRRNVASTKRSAMIYRRGDHFFAYAQSCTWDGLWIFTEPVLKLDEGATDEDIASVIQQSLAGSRVNVKRPTDWNRALAPLLQQAEVKSWRIFARGATCVAIDADADGSLTMIPMKKRSNAFEARRSLSLSFTADEVKELGAAVRKLLT